MAARPFSPRILAFARAIVPALLAPSPSFAQAPNDSPATILLTAPADLSKLGNLRISRLDIVQTGDRWRSPATLTSVRVGDPFNPAIARRAARELLASGGFSNATITALPEADGVVLRFELTPRRVIAIRRLDGAGHLRSCVGFELTGGRNGPLKARGVATPREREAALGDAARRPKHDEICHGAPAFT